MSNICIIDYKTGGNIFSVQNSLKYIGAQTLITSDTQEILKASKIVFPGVGSYQIASKQINELGIADALTKARAQGTPILGICVGMQIMFERGTEGGGANGLGFFKGTVDEFDKSTNLKIPHMGWNQVDFGKNPRNPLAKNLSSNNFYFVHSFKVNGEPNLNPTAEIATTAYGVNFISHIWDGANTWGSQFHIEKSGEAGLQILKNFVDL